MVDNLSKRFDIPGATISDPQQLLTSGLPPSWRSLKDEESGNTYYWNTVTNETTWERPQLQTEPELEPETEQETAQDADQETVQEIRVEAPAPEATKPPEGNPEILEDEVWKTHYDYLDTVRAIFDKMKVRGEHMAIDFATRYMVDPKGADLEAMVAQILEEERQRNRFSQNDDVEAAHVANVPMPLVGHAGREGSGRHPVDGRLAGGVDVGDQHGVRVVEGPAELLGQVAAPRVAVRLEAHHQASAAVKVPRGAQRGGDLRRVVSVVVDDQHAALLALAGPVIAGLFTDSETALDTASMHMRIVPISYAALGVAMVVNGAFNAVGKPLQAMITSLCRTILVYAPLAFLFAKLFGLVGVFAAACTANFVAGSIGGLWWRSVFSKQRATEESVPAT